MPLFDRRALSVLWLALLTALAAPASASPVERLHQMSVHPMDPSRLVVSYENGAGGLLYSQDGGRSFKLVCSSMVSTLLKSVGKIAITGDGRLMMARFEGMWQDDGRGCQWGLAPGLNDRCRASASRAAAARRLRTNPALGRPR